MQHLRYYHIVLTWIAKRHKNISEGCSFLFQSFPNKIDRPLLYLTDFTLKGIRQILKNLLHYDSVGAMDCWIFSRSVLLGISVPRGNSRAFNIRVFERWMSLSRRTRPLSKTGLFRQGLEKLADVFKGMVSQF